MKIETLEVAGFAAAFSALRLPFGKEVRSRICTGNKVDTITFGDRSGNPFISTSAQVCIHPKDLALMNTLVKRGTEHAKVTRGIMVWAKITAPRMWWQEFDTYRIGVEKLSSESTMHMIGMRDLTIDDFSVNDVVKEALTPLPSPETTSDFREAHSLEQTIDAINNLAMLYRETKDGELLYDIKALIPESFNQTRVAMMSYQALRNIARQRWNHRLPEWHAFVDWIKTLPFAQELILDGLDIKEKED